MARDHETVIASMEEFDTLPRTIRDIWNYRGKRAALNALAESKRIASFFPEMNLISPSRRGQPGVTASQSVI